MKRISLLPAVLFFIGLGAACTINLPYDAFDDVDGVQVMMEIVPDDADVLLNGRLIGSAYEFATSRSALRLASRQNELAFKKKGYAEEVVDLSTYSSRNITLKFELAAPGENEPVPSAGKDIAEPTHDKAYDAESEALPPLPAAEKPVPAEERLLTPVILTVTPFETSIYIDGKFWGLAPAEGKIENLRLKPGKYVFEAFKPGFAASKKEVVVPKGNAFTLVIALQKKNPPIL